MNKHTDIVVEGMDDRGEASGAFIEVKLAAVVDAFGQEVCRSADPDQLLAAFAAVPGAKLVAVETVGEPVPGLTGRITCDEQGGL